MRLSATAHFVRRARKLSPVQQALLRAALRRLAANPRDPVLYAHKLKGELAGYWAFSVDENLRVLFRWTGDLATLVALGGHDELY